MDTRRLSHQGARPEIKPPHTHTHIHTHPVPIQFSGSNALPLQLTSISNALCDYSALTFHTETERSEEKSVRRVTVTCRRGQLIVPTLKHSHGSVLGDVSYYMVIIENRHTHTRIGGGGGSRVAGQ